MARPLQTSSYMRTLALLGLASLVTFGCSGSVGGDVSSASEPAAQDVAFHAEAPVLPDFKYDTGLQPASGPAQAQITLSAGGAITVDATAAPAEGKLQGKPGGVLKLDLHLKLAGHL